jgi:hypothetical protein
MTEFWSFFGFRGPDAPHLERQILCDEPGEGPANNPTQTHSNQNVEARVKFKFE